MPAGLLPAPLCPGTAVVRAALGTQWLGPCQGCWVWGGSPSCPWPRGSPGVSAPAWLCWSSKDWCVASQPGAGMCPPPARPWWDHVPIPSPLPAAPMPAGPLARKRQHGTAPELSGEARVLCGRAGTTALRPRSFLGHFPRWRRGSQQELGLLPHRLPEPGQPGSIAGSWLLPAPLPWLPGARGVPSPGAGSETRWVTRCPVRGLVTVAVGDRLARLRGDLFAG